MSNLFIAAFGDAKEVAFGSPIQEQVVSFTTPSVQSAVLTVHVPAKMYRVRILADADCFVTWGDDPTALIDGTNGRPVGANNPEYFGIPSGQRLAVIQRV